ncbi:MAG: LLM class flavin-dependent oxidoreductase [Thaumarchaeota archaeon]|nr:LLM class flavin-dependent oxidoreductase [Nitrososphaerota archaeon]
MPARAVTDLAQQAEKTGIDSLWFYEMLGRDAVTLASAAALATNSIRLGTGLLSLPIRTPTLTAMTAASLDEISNGRFLLGLGVSYEQALRRRHGIVSDRPFTRLKEYIDIVRGIVASEEFSYQGRIFQLDKFTLGYETTRKRIPIFVGAHNPKMLEFAGEYADGVLLNVVTKEEMSGFMKHLEAGARRAGRSLEQIEVASYFNVCAAKEESVRNAELRSRAVLFLAMPHIIARLKQTKFATEAEAVEKLFRQGRQSEIAHMLSDQMIDELCISDSPKSILDTIERYRNLGISLPILFPTPINGDVSAGYREILSLF